MKVARLKAFAKINLGLKVLGRRSDGYHELRTVYQTISFADSIEVCLNSRARNSAVSMQSTGLAVPQGGENLAIRAAHAMMAEAGIHGQISIRLRKRIPAGGGLGGGSSDAAAVLRALDHLSGRRIGPATLLRIAARLGSDVPFFLIGGRALGLGRGEEVYPLPEAQTRYCLIAVPEEGMGTPEAFRLLGASAWPAPFPSSGRSSRESLTRPDLHPSIAAFCAALLGDDAGTGSARAGKRPENDFEQLLFNRFPKLAMIKRIMVRNGSDWAALTGSGSAVFGLFTEAGAVLKASQQAAHLGMRLYQCRTIGRSQYNRSLEIQ